MPEFVRVEALVLHPFAVDDKTHFVQVYSREYGRITVKARALHTPTAKLALLKNPFDTLVIELIKGKHHWHPTGTKLLTSRQTFATDLTRYTLANAFAELILQLTPEDDPSPALYERIVKTYDELLTAPDPELAFASGALKLLSHLGFLGALSTCTTCGKKITPEKIYITRQGLSCCPGMKDCSLELAKILLFLQQSTGASALKIEPKQKELALLHVRQWSEELIGRPLRSLA